MPVSDKCSSLDKSSPDWKRLDCQTDLHMNFYGVTLGAQGKIYGVNQAATDDPYKNPPNWAGNGNPLNVDDGTVIDELWHGSQQPWRVHQCADAGRRHRGHAPGTVLDHRWCVAFRHDRYQWCTHRYRLAGGHPAL